MAAALCFPVGLWWSHRDLPLEDYLALEVFAVALSLLLLIRHRANIMRLLRGEELGFSKKCRSLSASPTPSGAGSSESEEREGRPSEENAESNRDTSR